ncbi:uncharacterized protein LOC130980411 [Arachis stenosperma]|uniref:uncharacterized protein LOC130980411 n=1 Tax=Arachis stenosperma TaxID=217475 RepID=UPI0025AD24F7|nr:uncharacterized protein LOC130980411 [Arachis stenosperma]
MLTAIYGSPQRLMRKSLWDNLRDLRNSVDLPWCTIGDFNAILHSYEKRGGAPSQSGDACPDFISCVSDVGLLDLGFSGFPFTWKRGNLFERLDRALSDIDWQIKFPEASIKHLPSLKSDHSPIYLQLSPVALPNRRRRPFRFLAAWLNHPEFDNLVSNNWRVQESWSNGVENFKSSLKTWNSEVFGDINRKSQGFLEDFRV